MTGQILSQFLSIHNLKESFTTATGECAKSFPSILPLLKLDRIYYRNIDLLGVDICKDDPWNKLSDHLALLSDFNIKG
jgi:endonuclease/exonuclease/phosphatase family metal-dependent hydrolase